MYGPRAILLPLGLALLATATPLHRRQFQLANGQKAQQENAAFASLTPGSACNAGENACVAGQFAQCVGGTFVTVGCAGGLVCASLPLVNSPGTSITCTTTADAEARIAATGATGGLTGGGAAAAAPPPAQAPPAPAPAPAAAAPPPAAAAPPAAGVSFGTPPFNAATPFNINLLPPPNPACQARAKRSVNTTIKKRIAQENLPAIAQSWQDLCLVSGGDIVTGDPCTKLAGLDGISALLAGANECAQQDNADAMIDFAKSPGVTNREALIANAIAYRRNPRNTLDIGGQFIPSTPFCQRAPRNPELNGVVNGQLPDGNPSFFGGPNFAVVPFGDPRSCPFGQTPNVATCTCS